MNVQLCVYIVDDDDAVRDSYVQVMETAGFVYQAFANAEQFLELYQLGDPGCLLLDVSMPGLSGLELQAELNRRNISLPIIFLTGYGNVPMTVQAMKAGAADFLTKPVTRSQLIQHVRAALDRETELFQQKLSQRAICERFSSLTSRELEILPLVLSGLSNKQIAKQLGISYRTIEIHRTRIFSKIGAANLLELDHLYQTSCHHSNSALTSL